MTTRRALLSVAFWVTVSMILNVVIFFWRGPQAAAEYFGCWALEEALSLDNLFMFYFIFNVFRTPKEARPRVLAWGIVGVVVMRGLIILGGTQLISSFEPLLWFFAIFLVWAAFKIFAMGEDEGTEEERAEAMRQNWLVRAANAVMPFVPEYHGNRFFVVRDGKTYGTMLLLTLLAVEGTDVPFAFDSLPAAMAISQDFFIVASSNILAVAGLRSLYFVIEDMQDRFAYMKYGIGFLLAFAAFKILAHDYGAIAHTTVGFLAPGLVEGIPHDAGLHIPLPISLGIIVGAISLTILYTFIASRRAEAK